MQMLLPGQTAAALLIHWDAWETCLPPICKASTLLWRCRTSRVSSIGRQSLMGPSSPIAQPPSYPRVKRMVYDTVSLSSHERLADSISSSWSTKGTRTPTRAWYSSTAGPHLPSSSTSATLFRLWIDFKLPPWWMHTQMWTGPVRLSTSQCSFKVKVRWSH